MALTVHGIQTLIREKRPKRKSVHDKNGLYLKVKGPSNAAWVFKYERGGRSRELALGSLRNFTLNEARERARKARQLLSDGVDPVDARAAEKAAAKASEAQAVAKAVSFKKAAEMYFEFHQQKWKNDKHRAQFLSTLRDYAFPHFGDLEVAQVDKALVLKALDPIWASKTETASRVRQRIEAVLNFAKVRGYRDGENPARWKGHLDQVLLSRSHIQQVEHHKAMAFDAVPEFLSDLRKRQGTAARALEFTILTAARSGETIGAVWDEFDLQAGIWTIPKERMKAKREHRVPLSEPALRLLQAIKREKGNPFVFVGPFKNGLSNMAMAQMLRRMGKNDVTVHGFRSSFRDWVSERTNFAPEVAEAALAHVTGDAVERAYRRGNVLEKRMKLMGAWADYCSKPGGAGANVHAIRSAA